MSTPEIIQREIRPGEQIVWAGQPIQGIRLQAIDWIAIPATLIVALVLVSAANSFIEKGGPMNLSIAAFFLAVGVTITFGRFFINARLRARRYYAVTNLRALSINSGSRIQVESVLLRRLARCFVIVGGGGVGRIVFGSHNPSQVWLASFGQQPTYFERIPDAHRVFRLLVSTQRNVFNQRDMPGST